MRLAIQKGKKLHECSRTGCAKHYLGYRKEAGMLEF